jgi:Ni/Co efflux regulator RcnB
MKKLIIAAVALCCATAIMVQAQDAAPKKGKKKMTPEQTQLMAEMTTKYDTNKDGKLDKEEKAAMSQEDKDKLTAAGLGGKKKKSADEAAPAADAGK